jgi:plastocyanin
VIEKFTDDAENRNENIPWLACLILVFSMILVIFLLYQTTMSESQQSFAKCVNWHRLCEPSSSIGSIDTIYFAEIFGLNGLFSNPVSLQRMNNNPTSTSVATTIASTTSQNASQVESSKTNPLVSGSIDERNGNTSVPVSQQKNESNTQEKRVSIVPGASGLADKAYTPNPVSANVGDTVSWTNNDSTVHTVTSGAALNDPNKGKYFDSGIIGPKGKVFSFKFDKQGSFRYFCTVHPTMIGKVSVTERITLPSFTKKSTSALINLTKTNQTTFDPVINIVKTFVHDASLSLQTNDTHKALIKLDLVRKNLNDNKISNSTVGRTLLVLIRDSIDAIKAKELREATVRLTLIDQIARFNSGARTSDCVCQTNYTGKK